METVSQHQLEQVALGLVDDPQLIARIESSPELRARLEQIRADNELLAELASTGDRTSDRSFDEFPGYDILGEVHRGGQGVVYRARQRAADRVVAVKTLLQGAFATEGQRARFEREVRLAARLTHPGIVTLHEGGRTAVGTNYIVMEYVEGVPIDRAAAGLRGSGSVRDIISMFVLLCDAVHYAHQRGVIHRDLKPGNVLVDSDRQPHVLDFGIAKGIGDATGEVAGTTRTGEFVGTLAYAAPEQVSGEPDLADVRVDVYALGVMLYEALCGERPISTAGSLSAVIARILNQSPASLLRRGPGIDTDLNTIVLTALAKDPRERYQSASDLKDDLERWLSHRAIRARSHDAWYVARKALRRYRVPFAIVGTFAALLVGFLITTSLLAFQLERENEGLERTVSAIAQALARVDQETSNVRVSSLEEFLRGTNEALERWLTDRPDVAAALRNSLGLAYLDMDRFEDAESQLREALRLRDGLEPQPVLDVAETSHNLGRVLWRRGRYLDAAEVYERALRLRANELGPDHAEVARTRHHLAAVRQELGQLQVSESLWREVIGSRERSLGSTHPEVANSRLGLAMCLQVMGRNQDALDELETALAVVLPEGGPDSLPVGRVRFRMGSVLIDLKRLDEAEAMLSEARRINMLKDPESMDLARTVHELGRLEMERGIDLERARSLTEEARQLRAQRVSVHPSLAESDLQLGRLARAQGMYAEAETYLRAASAMLERAQVSQQNYDFACVQAELAWVLCERGMLTESARLATEAYEVLASMRAPGDVQVERVKGILSRIKAASSTP